MPYLSGLIAMSFSYANKTAVITGAASGLGRALALALLRLDCKLALLDVDIAGLEQLKAGMRQGPLVTIHHTDVSQEEQVRAAVVDIVRMHGSVDILINNAAISSSQPFEQVSLPHYRRLMDVNFWGTVYCTRYFLPHMQQRPQAKLVNIISDFALMGFPGKTTYASSKSAVMGFTNVLRTELTGTTVQLSLVIPPAMDTNIVRYGAHINEAKRAQEQAFLQRTGMPVDKAAERILKAISRGKYRIVTGPMMFWIDVVVRFFPTLLHRVIGSNKKRIPFV